MRDEHVTEALNEPDEQVVEAVHQDELVGEAVHQDEPVGEGDRIIGWMSASRYTGLPQRTLRYRVAANPKFDVLTVNGVHHFRVDQLDALVEAEYARRTAPQIGNAPKSGHVPPPRLHPLAAKLLALRGQKRDPTTTDADVDDADTADVDDADMADVGDADTADVGDADGTDAMMILGWRNAVEYTGLTLAVLRRYAAHLVTQRPDGTHAFRISDLDAIVEDVATTPNNRRNQRQNRVPVQHLLNVSAAQVPLPLTSTVLPTCTEELRGKFTNSLRGAVSIDPTVPPLKFCYLLRVVVPQALAGLTPPATPITLLKIGSSHSPDKRCRGILHQISREVRKLGLNFTLQGTLLALLRGGRETEDFLHELFGGFQVPLEFAGTTSYEFFLAQPVLDLLRECALLSEIQ